MDNYDASKIRNIVLLGHQGSGKTTLAESLAFMTKAIKEKGEVEKKNTISDYLEEEKRRGTSVQTSIIPIYYNDYKINIIDVPGNDDFISESIGVTGIVKGAVLVIDASSGVEMGTIKAFNMVKRKGIPCFIYINKMDKDDIDFEKLLGDIREKLGRNTIPFCYPLGHGSKFDGFANIIEMRAKIFDGKTCNDAEIYPDTKAKCDELHNVICEAVATTSDELLDRFFAGEQLSIPEIRDALRKGVIGGELIPVLVGSATKNIGIDTMLSMFVSYLPNPSELKPYDAHDEAGTLVTRLTKNDEPFSAYIFKTVVDPYSGIINIFKVNSGVLHVGDEVYVNGNIVKISTLFIMTGKSLTPTSEISAGDIGATTKLENVATTMTLCSPKSIIKYKEIKYPTAVIFKSIVLKNKNDESKIGIALQKMQLEDPCVEVKRNNETKQLLLGGVSDTHIKYTIDKLKNIYKIDVDTEPMKIVYRESIKKTAEGEGKYIKQSGGSGFYGVVKMRFEPSEECKFEDEVFGGSVPKNYFPAVEKGFFEALKSGLLAGFPVIGVKAVLFDGKYHPVDSNEQAFKMASILAFKDAYLKCDPIILEPIIRIKVNCDSKYLGDVLGDLNTRRARIQNIEEGEHEVQVIEALVPEAEIINYATQLKALTQASGYFNREFEKYEEVPSALKDKVIADNKITE